MIKQSQFNKKISKELVSYQHLFLALENMSKTNFEILRLFFWFFKKVYEDAIDYVSPSVNYIASKVDCSERTVQNFSKNFHFLVARKFRKKINSSKNLPNDYRMDYGVFLKLKTLAGYGLFSSYGSHKVRVKYIVKAFAESNYDPETFERFPRIPKQLKNKDLKGKKPLVVNKKSKNFSPINPKIFHPNLNQSITYRKEQASLRFAVPNVPPKFAFEIDRCLKLAHQDLEFVQKKQPIRSASNFLKSRFLAHIQGKSFSKKQAQSQKADNPSEYKPGKSWNSYTNSWTAPRPTVQETPKKYRYELGT